MTNTNQDNGHRLFNGALDHFLDQIKPWTAADSAASNRIVNEHAALCAVAEAVKSAMPEFSGDLRDCALLTGLDAQKIRQALAALAAIRGK